MSRIESSRRTFMAQGLTGLASAALLAGAGAGAPAALAAGEREGQPEFGSRAKLRAISSRAKQLWPVIYLDLANLTSTLERDIDASFEGGADAVVMELGRDPATLERAVEHARRKYPSAKIGVNYLGGAGDEYGFINGFRLAKDYALDIVWVDFCGVDRIQELPEVSLHEIESRRALNAFYVSGIHMKYGTLIDPNKTIEQSALQAMGWVEGVVVTGSATGQPTDPDRARRARGVLGAYPMGAASGVSAENFRGLAPYVDYCLVNTSISDSNHRILKDKVRELRTVMG